MALTILLLAVLFIAGLVNILFYFPTDKIYAWLRQNFLPNNAKSTASFSSPTPKKERGNVYQQDELRKVFSTFDKNGDGFITRQELRESLRNIRIFMTDKEIEDIVLKFDSNGDGLIDFDEFCLLTSDSMAGQVGGSEGDAREGIDIEDEEENLKEAFDVFDKDKDGLISVDELAFVLTSLGLKEGKKIEDCIEMIRKVDMDGDGMVNFNEFKRMMMSGGKLVLAS